MSEEVEKRITAAMRTLAQQCYMISFTAAKRILNKEKQAYDDEQVKEILRTLTIMAEQQIITEKYREEKYHEQND